MVSTRARIVPLLLVTLAISWPSRGLADRYSDAMNAAVSAASAGDWGRAADILGVVAREYPEDYTIHLKRAYYLFRKGDYRAASASYEKAAEISGGSVDALLGLGWCAQRSGNVREARARFEAVISMDPDNASAVQGLAMLPAPDRFSPWAYVFFEKFQGHPWRNYHVGTAVGLDSVIDDNLLLDICYRYINIRSLDNGMASQTGLNQHEAHVTLGFATHDWGIAVHGSYAHYSAPYFPVPVGVPYFPVVAPGKDSGAAGVSARYTYWADFTLAATYSFYDDFGVVQGDVGIAMPVTGWLKLSAAFEFQYGDNAFWPSGIVGLFFHGPQWSLALGGTYGTRLRPVDLLTRVIYNTIDRPSGSAWASASVGIGPLVTLYLSYGFERLLSPSLQGTDTTVGYGHIVSLGLSLGLHLKRRCPCLKRRRP